LDFNRIEVLGKEFGQLKPVRQLLLRSNKLLQFPETVCDLTRLEELNLNDNKKLFVMPGAILQLQSLVTLQMDDCGLLRLHDSIGYCTALRFLSLMSNSISMIPVTFSSLLKLEILNLSSNRMVFFPPVCHMTGLVQMNLANNEITTLSLEIGDLVGMEVIPEPQNAIVVTNTDVKDRGASMIRLWVNFILHVICTGVEPGQQQDCRRALYHWYYAFAHGTRPAKVWGENSFDLGFLLSCIACVTGFRSTLLNLPLSAVRLFVCRNRISSVPHTIGMLHKLVQLRLHTNLLKSLPTSLTELTNLELLTLRDNEIGEKKAPEFLSSLHKLKTLTLGKNKMKKLPDLELQGDSAYDTKWMVRVAVSLSSLIYLLLPALDACCMLELI
jgi:Leucine-rich repeat (LRR) protein